MRGLSPSQHRISPDLGLETQFHFIWHASVSAHNRTNPFTFQAGFAERSPFGAVQAPTAPSQQEPAGHEQQPQVLAPPHGTAELGGQSKPCCREGGTQTARKLTEGMGINNSETAICHLPFAICYLPAQFSFRSTPWARGSSRGGTGCIAGSRAHGAHRHGGELVGSCTAASAHTPMGSSSHSPEHFQERRVNNGFRTGAGRAEAAAPRSTEEPELLLNSTTQDRDRFTAVLQPTPALRCATSGAAFPLLGALQAATEHAEHEPGGAAPPSACSPIPSPGTAALKPVFTSDNNRKARSHSEKWRLQNSPATA